MRQQLLRQIIRNQNLMIRQNEIRNDTLHYTSIVLGGGVFWGFIMSFRF